jgi:hypothetical protein
MATNIVRMARGSKEYIDVTVTDETDQVTTLVGTNPKFDVLDDTNTAKQSAVNCNIAPDGMMLQCLVDTNAGGLWALGHYNLYVYWTIGSETPREGPFDIYVV